MIPGDSQEVNCPEGAREATLGCGPMGLGMTRNSVNFVGGAAQSLPIEGKVAARKG